MQVDPTVAEYTGGQFWLAVGALVLAFVVAAVIAIRLRYAGLDSATATVVAQVQRQLSSQSPGTVRLSPDEDLEPRRDDIAAAFTATGRADDSTRLREAGHEAWTHFWEAVRPYLEHIPPTARRFGALAIVIAVFGTLALAADTLRALLAYSPGGSNLAAWPGLALSETQAAIGLAHDWATTVPLVGPIGDLLYAFVILGAEWGYRHYWVFAVVLAGVAGALYYHREQGGEHVALPLPAPRDVVRKLALLVGTAWAVLLFVIGVSRAARMPATAVEFGAATVLLFATVAGLTVAVVVGQLLFRTRALFRAAANPATRMRLGARFVGLAVAVVVGPLLPLWVGVGLTKVPGLLAAWVAAALPVQLLTVLLGLVAIGGVAYAARDARDSVLAGLIETMSRRGWQAAVFGRGVPLGVVVLAYVMALGLRLDAVSAAVIAVAAGAGALMLWRVALRFRERVALLPDASEAALLVVVHAYRLETDAGPQWVARVNSDIVAHETREGAVDAVLERARECFADRDERPTVGTAHAEALREDGVTDVDETRSRLQSEARRYIEGKTLRRGGVDADSMRQELIERIPPEIAEVELAQHPARHRSRVVQRDGSLLPA